MKNPTKKQLLLQLFNFQYGGIIDVHIAPGRNKYLVCSKGFKVGYDGELELDKDCFIRHYYDDLETAILVFSKLVQEICLAFEFFKYNYFDTDEFKKSALKGIFN